jgi:ferredoxin
MDRVDFQLLFDSLRAGGYTVIGPTVRDGAIVYSELRCVEDLPIGWTDRQEAGAYHLERRSDRALFGYNVGPHSWKGYLYPARERLWTGRKSDRGFDIEEEKVASAQYAFIGVRACELAAIAVQDRVFDSGSYRDPGYHERRGKVLYIAVQCGQAGENCFCVSMGTGPRVEKDYDLSLTELLSESSHRFLIEVGSSRGADFVLGLPVRPASDDDIQKAEALVDHTASTMKKTMDTEGIHDILLGRADHPQWHDVAKRCLTCANCTLVCPTCFCSTTEEVPDLDGDKVERWRRWDSCFNLGFTQLIKSYVRKSVESRYRQWLTHKLASWYDQFGTSGCVGCGRCITWCPVGIDLTKEVVAIREVVPTINNRVG